MQVTFKNIYRSYQTQTFECKCKLCLYVFKCNVFEIQITQYADSVATHLTKILDSDKHSDVISSAKWV